MYTLCEIYSYEVHAFCVFHSLPPQLEEKQLRRRKRSVASPSSSDGSATPTSKSVLCYQSDKKRDPCVFSPPSHLPRSSLPPPSLPPSLFSGKRRRVTGGSSASSRSNSVKRETTPVSRANITIAHSQQQQVSKPFKPGKKQPHTAVRRPANQDLGCNEEIGDEEEEEEEAEGECSATQCLQPVADQIIWVQCDHCHEWFHCICVGLTKEYAEQIDIYKCASCKQAAIDASAPSSASTSAPLRPVYSSPLPSSLSHGQT